MVCTSEWQEGCWSCSSSFGYWHLSPSVFLLPSLFLPPQHTSARSCTHKHTVPLLQRSPLPKHLCHLSLSSLKPFAVALLLPLWCRGLKRRRREKGEKGRQRGTSHSFWRAHMFWKVLLWQQKLSSDMCPIDTWKWLPTQQKWWDNSPCLQIGRWECDVKEEKVVEVPPAAWKLKMSPAAVVRSCLIDFRPLPTHHCQCRPLCRPSHHQPYHH